LWIKESIDEFVECRKKAHDEGNYPARITFDSIIDVMLKAGTTDCMKWAAYTEIIIEKVFNGRYAGTHDDARKLLNGLSRGKKVITKL